MLSYDKKRNEPMSPFPWRHAAQLTYTLPNHNLHNTKPQLTYTLPQTRKKKERRRKQLNSYVWLRLDDWDSVGYLKR